MIKFRLIVGVILLLAGCSQRTLTQTPDIARLSSKTADVTGASTTSPIPGFATPDRHEQPMTKLPERVPPTEATTPVVGEVPSEILDAILKDLTERTSATLEQISVTQAQTIVWNDGSLGCAQPGMFYTQALVNGFWVIMEVDGKRFDYRASETGYFFLCENGSPPISPPGTPSS